MTLEEKEGLSTLKKIKEFSIPFKMSHSKIWPRHGSNVLSVYRFLKIKSFKYKNNLRNYSTVNLGHIWLPVRAYLCNRAH